MHTFSSAALMQEAPKGRAPVKVHQDSVSLDIEKMELNRYYLAELGGEPYLYRKISEHEIEVYGLAEQD